MNILTLLVGALKGSVNGRDVARDAVNGLVISTIFAGDTDRFETALLDADRTHVVERYEDEAAAIEGHKRWCERAETLETVLEIGYGDVVPPETRVLRRATPARVTELMAWRRPLN